MTVDQKKSYEVTNVLDAITVFKHLLETNEALGLAELGEFISFSKNKAFRLLATLEHCGFVEKDPQSKYSIGFAAYDTARKIMSKVSNMDYVRPYLKEVTNLVNESTYYAYLGADDMLLVDFADCCHPIKVASLVGRSIKLPSVSTYFVQPNRLDAIGDIIVDAGGFDPEVTVVIAPLNYNINASRGALVVVAPIYRMHMERIKAKIVPALRAVLQRNSQLKLISPDYIPPKFASMSR